MRGAVAVVGIGETPYYKRGTSPDADEKLCLKAIVAACEDAGLDPRDVDGFISYGADLNEAPHLTGQLGTRELRWSTLLWGGGAGPSAAVISTAAAAIYSGQAETVAVYRSMSESVSGRLSAAVSAGHYLIQYHANGVVAPAQTVGLATQRMIEADGVPAECLRELVLASYHHAQNNPAANAYGKPLTRQDYENSRWVVEPFRLFDCSRENDGAAAMIITSAERARHLAKPPAYVLASGMGGGPGAGALEFNHEPFAGGMVKEVADRMYRNAGLGPSDIDVAQVFINFSGGGVASLIDHGLCTPENAGEVLSFENLIAPNGGLPVNTAGGDLGHGFLHGMGNALEAVRQIRGESCNQVPGAEVSLLTGGPMSYLASSALLGAASTL
jgi:acetyl-CoA acetyltransferase